MKGFSVEINGKSYPWRMTMGAMLRFKRETGREINDADLTSVSDIATLLWCGVASACKADHIEFDMPLMDFCDACSEDDMQNMLLSMASDTPSEEKKSRRK